MSNMDDFRPPENPYGPPVAPSQRTEVPSQRGYRGGSRARQQRQWSRGSGGSQQSGNSNLGYNGSNTGNSGRGRRDNNYYGRRPRDKSREGWGYRQYNDRQGRSYRDGSSYRDSSSYRDGSSSHRDRSRDSWQGQRQYNDRSSRSYRENSCPPRQNRLNQQHDRQPPWHQERYHQYPPQNGIVQQSNWATNNISGSSGPHGPHSHPHSALLSQGVSQQPHSSQSLPGQLGPPGVPGHSLQGAHGIPQGPPGQISHQGQISQGAHIGHIGQHEHERQQSSHLSQPGAPGTHSSIGLYSDQSNYQEPAPFQGQLPPHIQTWDQHAPNYHHQHGHHYPTDNYYHHQAYEHYTGQYSYINGSEYNQPIDNKHTIPPHPPPQPPNVSHFGIQHAHTNTTHPPHISQLRSPISPNRSYQQPPHPQPTTLPIRPTQQPVIPPPSQQGAQNVPTGLAQVNITPLQIKPTELYEKLGQVGEGTYGKVYKAKNRDTGEIVALKRIRMESEKEGFPVTALREIKLLQRLRHDHIVHLKEIMVYQGVVYMVFEYMDHDLTGVLSNPQIIYEPHHVKCLMKQLLEGLAHLHENQILHRDVKGSNILLNNRGELKLADFGLARHFKPHRMHDYTNRVITLWYRPPELCLGATEYGPEVDLWSAGPLFPGADEISQLEKIFELMGVPTCQEWPSIIDLPWYVALQFPEILKPKFREIYSKVLSSAALELVEALLSVNPAKRPSAREALNFAYFTSEEPLACSPGELPEICGDWHEYESKQRKKKTSGPNP
ncbi:10423_t:CDS:2 [Racocetra persica]|uniref:10423_t:CDS:1 n=1 Tax=Racocetra persica TaxID=160502 RepID=A0ACA9LXP1_9GLOM|nr:10423_t:CDS:2 [Racocetra persica]